MHVLWERWVARVADMEGVGVHLWFKYDGKLFRKCTGDAQETHMAEWQFADDAAPLATTPKGAEQALQEYIDVARCLVSKSGSRRSN